MVAMRASVKEMYKNTVQAESKPTAEAGRISSMSMTMSSNLTRTLRAGRNSVQSYQGPHIAGHALDKNHMPVVTNNAHSTNTNNGFARKPSGGFYFH
jgi:hypothetical protein